MWDFIVKMKDATLSLVSYPARTVSSRASNGLVHQVQILGPVPQNEECPIKLQNDYIITSE